MKPHIPISILRSVPITNVKRQTDNVLYQALNYEHLHKPVNDQTDNVLLLTVSNQFYDPKTKKEFIHTIQTHFQVVHKEKIFHNTKNASVRHPWAIELVAGMWQKAVEISYQELKKVLPKDFEHLELPLLSYENWLKKTELILNQNEN